MKKLGTKGKANRPHAPRPRGRRGGRNRRGRGRGRGRGFEQEYSFGRGFKSRPEVRPTIPEEIIGQFVLLDEDDFYGLNLDLVLFNFSRPSAVKVDGPYTYNKLQVLFSKGMCKDNIYIIDELFGEPNTTSAEVAKFIREQDPAAKIIGCTAKADGKMDNADVFDKVIVKSKRNSDMRLTSALAEILGIEFIEDNSDPEYSGADYMDTLKQNLMKQHDHQE